MHFMRQYNRLAAIATTAILHNSSSFGHHHHRLGPLRHLAWALPTPSSFSSTTTTTTTCAASTDSSSISTTMSSQPRPIHHKIRVIPNDKLHVSEPDPRWFGNRSNPPDGEDPAWTNANWLKSRFHFNFAEYHSPHNGQYGVIRVLNDDLVQPHRGFGTHPHANMEIITYIVHGELTHQDSMGTKEALGRGSIQFMTAGTGVQHSEHNLGDKPLRFIQTWIVPDRSGLRPNYGSYTGDVNMRKNKWHHLVSNVSDTNTKSPVEIHQDLDGYVSELEIGQTVTFELPADRQAYLLCMEGSVTLNDGSSTSTAVVLRKYDACEIGAITSSPTTAATTTTIDSSLIEITATETEETEHGAVAHVLLYVMKAVPGSGRKDL